MAIEKIEHIATELAKALIIADPEKFGGSIQGAIDTREDIVKQLEGRFPPKRWGAET